MPFRLTAAAAEDVARIFDTGLDLFGRSQAFAYQDGLERSFAFLADFPRAARLRAETDPPVRVYRFKAHLIVYELDEGDTVVVLRVRHGAEDWASEAATHR